ncbi:hypothetical protein RND71_001783 [Anisodus tanguticus]|uniref:Calcium-binding protein 39-like n=1 Tax=Anisodus tanguticus TaxID=243964 RepID=A0AAE1T1Q6_9SOLA|nr:hypothetical protein RND71_001783 [Anisodus tanguticus]
MSFSFFKASRGPKTPSELAKAVKDSFNALDSITVAEVKALEKAMEEVEKNIVAMKVMLAGDGDVEPNHDQVSQLTLEVCNEDVIALFIHKLPILGWEARKNLVHCWSIMLKQKVDSTFCCVQYMEKHLELLDFLVVCYDNKEIALHCGGMLRECIKLPSLAKYILESPSFELFFKFVELPNFDVASDAFSTFKNLLTKHESAVSHYLTDNYSEFFEQYEKLLTSPNYVTRRQSLKLLSEFLLEPPNSHIMKRYIAEVGHLKVMMNLLKVFHVVSRFLSHSNVSLVKIIGIKQKHPNLCFPHFQGDIVLPLAILLSDKKGKGRKQELNAPGCPLCLVCTYRLRVCRPHAYTILLQVFVANPNKPREIKLILAKNHERLLALLNNLGKGGEDDQFEEEKELIMKEIEKVSRLANLES